MIDILGYKRVVKILILVAINAALALFVYVYMAPENDRKNSELRVEDSRISVLRSDIEKLRVEFQQLEEQKAEFETLKEKGFFNDQGRRNAELILQRVQERSGVITAVASIDKGTIEQNEDADKAEYKILKSPLNLQIQAIDDLDVFRYIYFLQENFPGHLAVEELNLLRDGNVNETVLRAIANGQNPPLVKADVRLMWRTMIPQNRVIAQ